MTPRSRIVGLAALVASLTLAGASGARAAERARLPEPRWRPVEISTLEPGATLTRRTSSGAFHPASLDGLDRSPSTTGFYRGHLAPRLDGQFRRMARYDALPVQGGALGNFALFDAVTREAERHASRGLRRAVRDWALETTALGRVAARFSSGASPRVGSSGDRSTTVGLAAAHGLPVVEIRHRRGDHLMRLGLAGYGAVRLDLGDARLTRTRVSAEYDLGDDAFRVSCRVGF